MNRYARLGFTVASLLGVSALAGPAFAATTVSATVGPVPIPKVPVEVCVSQTGLADPVEECLTTPPAQSVSLKVVATVETPGATVVLPKIIPVPCPAGTQGVAAQVSTGSAEVKIAGSVKVVVNGVPVVIPIDQVVAPASQTVTIYACAGISPGLPTLPVGSLVQL